MNPTISIVVPVYCVEKYLPRCIDSILAQTYRDFELVLVDDGSLDGSPVICDKYALEDERVRVVHQLNCGVSAARNLGIEHACGEWITFIDSDDWVAPNYLANFGLDETDGVDLVIQGLEYYNQRIDQFFKEWSFKSCTITEANFCRDFSENRLLEVGFPVGKAYRKVLLDTNDLRFDQRVSFHEDHIFVLDYYQLCHTIRLVDATDYKYRCYHASTSLSLKRHPWEKMNLAGDELLKRINEMRGRFYDECTDSQRTILSFAYDCKMDAAETIILSNQPYVEKRVLFYRIICKKQLSKCYFPNSLRNRLTKIIYLSCPFFVVYLYHWCIQRIKLLK